MLTVHVSGAVVSPGLVEVVSGSRVADVLAAVGGALPGADLGALNLAATVLDGARVVVPEMGSGGSDAAGEGPPLVSINVASASELEGLPGVGPVLAQRIVDHRSRFGPFREVEDLLDVPGIGEAKLAALRDFVALP